ncbi:hypothetical protein BU24DRAFT_490147 [Aaosphaeria arxii CBS 175.79]|uniref:BTB domain-containing protein n=1 Tax=Aaosphaeria arxii CBS 175.79 TaxID=1450172 RepID=A0A6A5XVM2_9PLEO|nr:uncharacterized protein BU24DRAFT_490147 [Aaosphaeria arxii CBS 175.79]KAF2016867.1 hypothetical protein BU24DRAFT_490147 [Aaosphaeria arxii CBS 175.79]
MFPSQSRPSTSPFGWGAAPSSGPFGSAGTPSSGLFGSAGTPSSGPFSSLPASAVTHSQKLIQHIASLFNNEKYSDATIQIHDVMLPVHKSIICIQSEYFEKAFQNERFEESQSGTIKFKENSGAAYWRVIEYLYKGDYSEALSTHEFEDDPEHLRDSRVYVLADMFLLEGLKTLSITKLRLKLEKHWMTDLFLECIREIYGSTSNETCGLRSTVIAVATGHARDLAKNEAFNNLLREGGDFAAEYVSALTKTMAFR